MSIDCNNSPMLTVSRSLARNLLMGTKQGASWHKSPSGVEGQSYGGDLGAKPPEAEDTYANNNYCNCVNQNKNPWKIFLSMEFLG